MDEMEWSQAKKIALDIYGDIDLYGNMKHNGDTQNDRVENDNDKIINYKKNLNPDVTTIKEVIETEDDALDGIIEDMLAILPRVEEEYLVSGACLKCSLATKETIDIDGVEFNTNKDGTSLLKVENKDMIGDVAKANIFDCKRYKNIMPFGNCKAELSEDEKKMLKANAARRQKGMCYFLMNISGLWENEPTKGGMEYFKYRRWPGINGMSKLFCYKKGKIMAITSGQENRNLSLSPGAVTKEDLQFAIRNGIGGKKIYALADIRVYFAKYPKLLEKTTIFAFEGLADEYPHGEDSKWNGDNDSHPNGQFGAIMFVAKEGKLTYYEGHASTLPDDVKNKPTVCEGVYETGSIKHKLEDDDGYAAIRLYKYNNFGDDVLKAYNSKKEHDAIDGVNLHMAAKMTEKYVYSKGCITVPVRCYRDFGVEVGFIAPKVGYNVGEDDIYGNAKRALFYDDCAIQNFTGYIVIDRDYYEYSEEYLDKGSNGEE